MKSTFRKNFLVLLLMVCGVSSYSQTVDTIEVYSPKMKRSIKNIVVLPAEYTMNQEKTFPVVYLLHGHEGNFKTWLTYTKKTLPEDASKWGVIIVCPDGQDSWYWDSPIDPSFQFDTYVSKELVDFIDTRYRTIASPAGRAVTGFSMGGHGGLWLGLSHPDVFGACGSMSGGLDIRPFPNNWDMKKRLGEYNLNSDIWEQHTVINLIDRIDAVSTAIIIDCGKDDFFYKVNESVHKKMLQKKIPHDYIIRPGKHTHQYWKEALDFHLLFFYKFFNHSNDK